MYFINREYPLLSLQRVCERASLSTRVRTLIYGGGAQMIILFHIFGYTGAGSHKHTILILPEIKGLPMPLPLNLPSLGSHLCSVLGCPSQARLSCWTIFSTRCCSSELSFQHVGVHHIIKELPDCDLLKCLVVPIYAQQ